MIGGGLGGDGLVRRLYGRSRRSWKPFYSPVVEFCLNFHFFGVRGARNLIFVHSYPLHAKGQLHATGFADSKFPCTFLLCKDQKSRDAKHEVFATICLYARTESVSFVTMYKFNTCSAFLCTAELLEREMLLTSDQKVPCTVAH